jgi:hypothetical protein
MQPYRGRDPHTQEIRQHLMFASMDVKRQGEFAPERILSTHKKRKAMKRRPRFPICIGTTLK